jgi:UDP-glucose 4-epimerase
VRGTFNVLEAMRMAGHHRIIFASSCSVYGEPTSFPSGEYNSAMPVQTSLYGASKLAGEALCQAYDSTYGFKSTIMRLVSQLGPGQTRGHLPDLFAKLMADPTRLVVMGNGRQQRSYMHIADCVDALRYVGVCGQLGIFNVSAGLPWTVVESIECLCEELQIRPEIIYGTEGRGWVGDSPHIEPDTSRLLATGWKPRYTTREAVIETIRDLYARWRAGL